MQRVKESRASKQTLCLQSWRTSLMALRSTSPLRLSKKGKPMCMGPRYLRLSPDFMWFYKIFPPSQKPCRTELTTTTQNMKLHLDPFSKIKHASKPQENGVPARGCASKSQCDSRWTTSSKVAVRSSLSTAWSSGLVSCV